MRPWELPGMITVVSGAVDHPHGKLGGPTTKGCAAAYPDFREAFVRGPRLCDRIWPIQTQKTRGVAPPPAPPHLTCTRWLGMEVEESHTTTVLRSRRISPFLFIGFCSFVAVWALALDVAAVELSCHGGTCRLDICRGGAVLTS